MIHVKRHIIIVCLVIFFFSCKKEHNNRQDTTHLPDKEFIHQVENVIDTVFYNCWKSDSIVAFEKQPGIEKQIVYTDSISEKDDCATKKIYIMRDKHKKIIKLKELDELNDGSLRTDLSAYFKNGKLIFIEYLNDMIEEPTVSYYIKSAVTKNEFDSTHFNAKTRVSINGNVDLPIEKASDECIFNALVLYDRMKDKFEK